MANDSYVKLDGLDLVHPDVALQLRRALWQIDGLKDAMEKHMGDNVSAVSAPDVSTSDVSALGGGDVEDR